MISGGASAPDIGMNFILAAIIGSGSFGFFFMTEGVRASDMFVVIPFSYSQLLFSVAAGILILW